MFTKHILRRILYSESQSVTGYIYWHYTETLFHNFERLLILPTPDSTPSFLNGLRVHTRLYNIDNFGFPYN